MRYRCEQGTPHPLPPRQRPGNLRRDSLLAVVLDNSQSGAHSAPCFWSHHPIRGLSALALVRLAKFPCVFVSEGLVCQSIQWQALCAGESVVFLWRVIVVIRMGPSNRSSMLLLLSVSCGHEVYVIPNVTHTQTCCPASAEG